MTNFTMRITDRNGLVYAMGNNESELTSDFNRRGYPENFSELNMNDWIIETGKYDDEGNEMQSEKEGN